MTKSESKYQRVQDKSETIEKRLKSETGLEYYSPTTYTPTYTDLPEQVGNDCRQRQMYNTKHKAGDSFLAQMEPHNKLIFVCFVSCSSGGSRCLVLISVGLGIICVLLLVFIILQYITITAERDLIKSLQDNYTDLMTEKHQLQNNFISLSQKKLELESNVTSLSEELKKETSKRGQYTCFCLFVFNIVLQSACFCVVQVGFSCPLS